MNLEDKNNAEVKRYLLVKIYLQETFIKGTG